MVKLLAMFIQETFFSITLETSELHAFDRGQDNSAIIEEQFWNKIVDTLPLRIFRD
jgi:hypothetical protein